MVDQTQVDLVHLIGTDTHLKKVANIERKREPCEGCEEVCTIFSRILSTTEEVLHKRFTPFTESRPLSWPPIHRLLA
jgi:hypothetical protein